MAPGDAEIGELWRRIQTEFHANQRAVVTNASESGVDARHAKSRAALS